MNTTRHYLEATQRKAKSKKPEIVSYGNNKPHLYKKIFSSIGEIETYYKLKRKGYLKGIMRLQLPDLCVKLHHRIKEHPKHLEIAKTIEKIFVMNIFESKNFKIPISLNAFFTTFMPLFQIARSQSEQNQEWLKRFFDKIKQIFDEDIETVFICLLILVDTWVVSTSDFRTTIICFEIDIGYDTERKSFFRINLNAERAQVKEFTIANNNRKAFRVGYCNGLSGLVWPNITLNGKEYTVFIQSHAIDALEKRIDCFDIHLSMDFIAKAIEKNDMVNFSGSHLLGYYWHGIKLGYLVCCFVSGCLLIKTFLFITMDGTPEGEKINEKFGLEKNGKRYLDIDKLSSFLYTDLDSDARIKEIFSELGIGQLFEITKNGAFPERKPRAEELKKILCLLE